MSQEEEIAIPQMIGFEILKKIIIGYLKVGADKEAKSYSEVANVANVGKTNVSLNANFLKSIGILEGKRGRYKLTSLGIEYAQALDWEKADQAKKSLSNLLKDKPLIKKTLGFIDINQPVDKEDLISQIAIFAGVPKEPRYYTGIKGYIDMLVTSGIVKEDKDNKIIRGKPSKVEPAKPIELEKPIPPEKVAPPRRVTLPISLTFNINDDTNIENLKKILTLIKEMFLEE